VTLRIIWFGCGKLFCRAEETANIKMLNAECNLTTALKCMRFVLPSKLTEKTSLVQESLANLGGMPIKIFLS